MLFLKDFLYNLLNKTGGIEWGGAPFSDPNTFKAYTIRGAKLSLPKAFNMDINTKANLEKNNLLRIGVRIYDTKCAPRHHHSHTFFHTYANAYLSKLFINCS